MSGQPAKKDVRSLIERAAEHYDLDNAWRSEDLPPIVEPMPTAFEQVSADETPAVETPVALAAIARELSQSFVPQVPVWAGMQHPIDRERLAELGLIQPDTDVTETSEEFRIVKRRVLSAAFDEEGAPRDRGNFVLVNSAHPGEGKTWCAINLALSLAAEQDMDVLLVDADFGKPGICDRLGLPEGTGLMDALVDPLVSIEQAVLRTDVPSLSVLPAGRHVKNDTEFVASERTRQVLDRLVTGNARRIVILDSPPVLAASPASELARHVGQAVFVVRADKTSEAALRDAVNLISACPNIRLLLNGVKFSSSGRQFGTYYGKSAA